MNKSYSKYVDIFVQNSGCFSYDHYVQGLRNYVKANLLNGRLGEVRQVPIDPTYTNDQPLALFLGETNRMKVRYEYIKDLLSQHEADTDFKFDETLYFEKLFEPYRGMSLIKKFRGCREIKRKTERVLKISEWLKINGGDYGGVGCFIKGDPIEISRDDYPLCINITDGSSIKDFVQLDGSHRRCVSAYLGYSRVPCLVVAMDEIQNFIHENAPAYFMEHQDIFFDLTSKVRAMD